MEEGLFEGAGVGISALPLSVEGRTKWSLLQALFRIPLLWALYFSPKVGLCNFEWALNSQKYKEFQVNGERVIEIFFLTRF